MSNLKKAIDWLLPQDSWRLNIILSLLECITVLLFAYLPFLLKYLLYVINTQGEDLKFYAAIDSVSADITIIGLVFHFCTILGAGVYYSAENIIRPISKRIIPLAILLFSFGLLIIAFVLHFGNTKDAKFNQPFTNELTLFLYTLALAVWFFTTLYQRRLSTHGANRTDKADVIINAIGKKNG